MGKYHDQDLIKMIVTDLNSKTPAMIRVIKKDLLDGYEEAREEVRLISEYTPPEETKRRRESLYYYQDIFEAMGW